MVASLGGLGAAWVVYGKTTAISRGVAGHTRGVHRLLVNKYYIDDGYLWIVRNLHDGFGRATALLDQNVVIGFFVDGTATTARTLGKLCRGFQTGKVRTYATYFLLGVAILTYLILRAT